MTLAFIAKPSHGHSLQPVLDQLDKQKIAYQVQHMGEDRAVMVEDPDLAGPVSYFYHQYLHQQDHKFSLANLRKTPITTSILAITLAVAKLADEGKRIMALREALWKGIEQVGDVYLNGHETQRIPGILNVSFAGVDGESLMMGLNDIAVSSGSACTSASLEPSYVLKAIGRSNELAHAGIRFSVGRFTTQDDIDYVITKVTDVVTRLREAAIA